jgi:hypothetical protein
VRQFYGAVQAVKALPERIKLPPAPKVPTQSNGIALEAVDALASVFGFKTAHQQATEAHTEAMKQWRETCKELRSQDAKVWDQMKARSAIAPLIRKQSKGEAPGQLAPTPSAIQRATARAKPR